jgi:hypothetical protein
MSRIGSVSATRYGRFRPETMPASAAQTKASSASASSSTGHQPVRRLTIQRGQRTADAAVPQPPSDLAAAASGDTAARLTWHASPTGHVYYWIYYRIRGAANWTRAAYPVTTCCSFTLSYLHPGKTYQFTLWAENLTGLSAPSNVAAVTLTIATPGRPGGIRAVPSHLSSDVRISWNAAANAIGYSVQVRSRGSTSHPWQTVQIMITGTSWTFEWGHGCYFYRVVADRFGKRGAPSDETLAVGTVDDYPWDTGGFPLLDPYLFFK